VELAKRLIAPADGALQTGDAVTFQVTISNAGATAITLLPLVDKLQSSRLVYVSAMPPPSSSDGSTIIWSNLAGPSPGGFGLPLAPGEAWIVEVDYLVGAGSTQCDSDRNEALVVGAKDEHGRQVPIAYDGVDLCVADLYEVDDSCAKARPITLDGVAQHHNFHRQGDEDWVSFVMRPGAEYTLTTAALGGIADTQLWLYGADCTTLLAFNDDHSPGSAASQIVYTAAEGATLYARVTDAHSRGDCGCYELAVVERLRHSHLYLPLMMR